MTIDGEMIGGYLSIESFLILFRAFFGIWNDWVFSNRMC